MSASAAGGRPRAGRPDDPREPHDLFYRRDRLLGRIELALALTSALLALVFLVLIW